MPPTLKTSAKKLLNVLFLNKLTIRTFNRWYENASSEIVKKIEPSLQPPSFDYTWKISVAGKPVRFTYKKGESRIIFHFPLSYKKNDTPLKVLETILQNHYPPDNYYFDIGANFGLRAIYYLTQKRPCILFEPNKDCNVITRRLIAENNFDSISIVSNIVGSENRSSKFYLSNSSYVSSMSKEYVEEMNDLKEEIDVDQITVDSFIESKGLKNKVSIIKIDVEGFEYQVCQGASQLLRSDNISLSIEVLPTTRNRQDLFDLLRSAGYTIFCVDRKEELKLIRCAESFLFTNDSIDFFATNDKSLLNKLEQFQ